MVICLKHECPYNKDGFCCKQYTVIHTSGLCDEWVWRNLNTGPRSVIEGGEEPKKEEKTVEQ